jgi:outer membrane protein OmpA-like peptidoglycan-associated protein
MRYFFLILLCCLARLASGQDCDFSVSTKVFFESAQSELDAHAKAKLDSLVHYLKGRPYCEIDVIARTDSIGSEAYNLQLSSDRAESVKAYLQSKGLSLKGLKMAFIGERKGADDVKGKGGLAYDRRAEVLVTFPIHPDSLDNYFLLYGFVTHGETGNPLGATVSLMGEDSVVFLSDSLSGFYTAIVKRQYKISLKSVAGGENSFAEFIVPGYRNQDSVRADITFDQEITSFEGKVIKPGEKISFENVYFYPNKAEFMGDYEYELDRMYRFLSSNPSIRVEIGGHINLPYIPPNAIGHEMQQLSEDRAKVVRDYLIQRGINPNRMTTKGYGNSQPVYLDPFSDREKQANRRVELIILD